jgi:hypothetical protein
MINLKSIAWLKGSYKQWKKVYGNMDDDVVERMVQTMKKGL